MAFHAWAPMMHLTREQRTRSDVKPFRPLRDNPLRDRKLPLPADCLSLSMSEADREERKRKLQALAGAAKYVALKSV